MSFQLKTDPSERQVYQVKVRPSKDLEEPQLVVMGINYQGIYIPFDMLSSIPHHAIVFGKDGRCVVGRIRFPSHLFWIRRPCVNVSKALCFFGLEQDS